MRSQLSPRAEAVQPLEDRRVRVGFTDGTIATVDLAPLLRGPVFARIAADEAEFARVGVSPEWGFLKWPGGVDIDPETLYELAVAGRASSA